MPLRADLDPMDIPHQALPFVMLMEVEHEPRRLLMRLIGTRVTELYGQEVTGRHLDELDLGDMAEEIQASYMEIVDNGKPGRLTGGYVKEEGRELQFERIALPLSLDGNQVDQILVGAVFDLIEHDQG